MLGYFPGTFKTPTNTKTEPGLRAELSPATFFFPDLQTSQPATPPSPPLPALCVRLPAVRYDGPEACGLNPQPRRLHDSSPSHWESCTDCCFSPPPSLLMGGLHCVITPTPYLLTPETTAFIVSGASCSIFLLSAKRAGVCCGHRGGQGLIQLLTWESTGATAQKNVAAAAVMNDNPALFVELKRRMKSKLPELDLCLYTCQRRFAIQPISIYYFISYIQRLGNWEMMF